MADLVCDIVALRRWWQHARGTFSIQQQTDS